MLWIDEMIHNAVGIDTYAQVDRIIKEKQRIAQHTKRGPMDDNTYNNLIEILQRYDDQIAKLLNLNLNQQYNHGTP
jgi:hypothetical protein